MIDGSKPPVYTDFRNVRQDLDPFLFISYSHKDSEFVYPDLSYFFENGLRYWYDDSLVSGDEWNSVAIKKMNDPCCAGVIFYLSKDMLCSEAIAKEVQSFCEIRSRNPNFIFKIISIEGKSVLEHLRDYFCDKVEMNCKELADSFPQERLSFMLSVFKDNVIYYPKTTSSDLQTADKVLEELKEFPLFANMGSKISELVGGGILKSVGSSYVMNFGSYPQELAEEVKAPLRDGVFTMSGSRYMASDWDSYYFRPIEWNLLFVDGDYMALVSNDCLDSAKGSCYLEWLNTEFKNIAFTPDEQKRIQGNIRLLNLDEFIHNVDSLTKPICSDYSKSTLQGAKMVVLWLDEDISGTKKKVCVSLDNAVLKKGMPVSAIAGLRPVLTLKINS